MRKKKVFITGATGFIGSHLTKRLVDAKYDVHILQRNSSSLWRIKSVTPNIKRHIGDITQRKKLFSIINTVKPDYIFHLANIGIYGGVEKDYENIIRVNLLGSMNLIDACSQNPYTCLVNTGSSSEYGAKDRQMDEADYCEPQSIYAISKLATTHYAMREGNLRRKPIVTLRLFSPYGPFDDDSRFIPQMITAIVEKKKFTITNPNNVRDFIYVYDIIDAYIACITHSNKLRGEIINIGTGEQIAIKDAAKIISNIGGSGESFRLRAGDENRFESSVWRAKISKAKKLLNWKPKTTFADGIKDTVAWNKDIYKKSR